MGFRSFHYFLVAAEELHFSRAAHRLFITQQSLSAHIQKLEQRYDVVLFDRKPTLRLTLAGERMVEHAKRILEIEAKMNAEFADISEHKKGKLSVGITRTRGQVFMPLIWERYHREYPNIAISLVEAMTLELEEDLQNGKIDVYIGVNAPESPVTHKIPLFQEQLYCIVSKALLQRQLPRNYQTFLQTYSGGVDLLAIKDFPFIMLPKRNMLRTSVDYYFAQNQIVPEVVFETSEHDLIFRLSRNGSGVGFVSQMYLHEPLSDPGLGSEFYVLPIISNIEHSSADLVYRSGYKLPQYTQAFISIAEEVIQLHMGKINELLYINKQ